MNPPRSTGGQSRSSLLQKASLQHKTAAVHLAVHRMVAAHPSDAFDLGAHFQQGGRADDHQVFDQHRRVAVLQHLAVGVFDHGFGFFHHRRSLGGPLKALFSKVAPLILCARYSGRPGMAQCLVSEA